MESIKIKSMLHFNQKLGIVSVWRVFKAQVSAKGNELASVISAVIYNVLNKAVARLFSFEPGGIHDKFFLELFFG